MDVVRSRAPRAHRTAADRQASTPTRRQVSLSAGGVTIPAYVFSGAAIDGELWLATSDGLYVVSLAANRPVGTKVVGGSVFSVALTRCDIESSTAAQSARRPANSLGDIAVHEIDADTHAVIAVGSPLPIGKESIAIVGDQIWVGGYGSGSTPRLFHLDGSSLQTLQTTGLGVSNPLELGPGAIVWPGASVVWVRSGGSEGLACIDPQSGAVLEQWDAVQGPVLSVRGHALRRQRRIARAVELSQAIAPAKATRGRPQLRRRRAPRRRARERRRSVRAAAAPRTTPLLHRARRRRRQVGSRVRRALELPDMPRPSR